jgi:DNA-binding protein H-NS
MAIDRTYRTNPAKFQADLKRKIIYDATEQMRVWESKGRLPAWMRAKNHFTHNKVVLHGER